MTYTKQLNPKWLNLLKLQFQHNKCLEVEITLM